MTTRLFSILRRKPGLVDFVAPLRDGVSAYRLKTDTTPVGAFATTLVTVPMTGFMEPELAGAQHVIQPGNNVRIIFKPSKYSLPDSGAFWLKLVYINAAGTEMSDPAPSAPTFISPPNEGPMQTGFTAVAPASALRIDLPTVDNFRIRNLEAARNLVVAFQEGGPEATVYQASDSTGITGTVSSIWINGSGGTANFSAQFTYAASR
jgi:uncharacterized protein YodC (DUF2158 family)